MTCRCNSGDLATRFVFWFGDALGRARARHPFVFWSGMYLLLVVGTTFGLHYIPRPSTNDPSRDVTFSWAGSLGIAVPVGFVGLGVARLFEAR